MLSSKTNALREALSETLPVRIATGEIRAYLPVSSDEGMAAGSGTSLEVRMDQPNWASGVKFQAISTKNSAW